MQQFCTTAWTPPKQNEICYRYTIEKLLNSPFFRVRFLKFIRLYVKCTFNACIKICLLVKLTPIGHTKRSSSMIEKYKMNCSEIELPLKIQAWHLMPVWRPV